MPLDAIYLSALCTELKTVLAGARIEKIHQPARDELILSLRGGLRLLLSASPTRPRAQLTTQSRENPAEPPMFCMLLRKHLGGGRILDVVQPPMERMLEFHIEAADELGDRTVKRLILELMGRRANLLLLDAEGRIVDCLRKVDFEMSKDRQLLPGMFYHPPTQEKESILALTAEMPLPLDGEEPIEQYLLRRYAGISPLIARELAFEVGGDAQALLNETTREALLSRLLRLTDAMASNKMTPYLLIRDGNPVDFSFRPILQYGPETISERQESFSQLLDRFYGTREQRERMRQKGQELNKTVTTARDRVARKLGFQRKELLDTQNRKQLREKGDLITANLYRMEKGMGSLTTENFYDPEMKEIRISLDPLKTPQQNAARYYKDYNRMKTAEVMLTQQIEKGERELKYLSSVLEILGRAEGVADLDEIRQELVEEGYLRPKGKAKARMKRPASKALEFRSNAGLRISVGRTNTQNDALTMKQAGKNDLWFHTKDIHGAHVILWTEGSTPDVESMHEAALLAAFYSQGRESANVPVDYTLVKYVKKPSGAKPGMVIYTHHETTFVTPNEAQVQALKEVKKATS